MKFKKVLLGLTAAASVAAPVATTVACGSSATTAAAIEKNTPVKANNVWFVADGGSLTDKSFNQSSWEGVKAFKADAKSYAPTKGQIKDGYRAAKKDGAEVVVGAGFNHESEAAWFTADQGTTFIGIDTDLTKEKNEKLASILFHSEQAGFEAGAYAVDYILSHTGEFTLYGGKYQVATFGGETYPTVTSWMDGFVEGVKQANTAAQNASSKPAQVEVIYTNKTGPSATDFTSGEMFAIPSAKTRTITDNLIAQGVDIIFPVAGPQIQDSIQAASGKKVKFIGVDGDQVKALSKPDVIIGSALKKLTEAAHDALTAFYADKATFKTNYIDQVHYGNIGFVKDANSLDLTDANFATKEIQDAKLVSAAANYTLPSTGGFTNLK